MQSYKNLVLIGTSHIAIASVREVEENIERVKPNVVALELDNNRYSALINKEVGRLSLKHIRIIGVKGYVFAKVGEYAERKLGSFVGVNPGDEMLKAAEIGKKNGSKIALIDQNIEVTLKKFSKEITWKEKFRFFIDLIKSPFSKRKIKFDLTKVPDKKLIKGLLEEVKKRYPNAYKVLVTERNRFMAKKLFVLMKNYDKIVGVIGAGHEEEIIEEIKRLEYSN